jgi:hypothetical protein
MANPEFLKPYEPTPDELLHRALRDPILPGRERAVFSGFLGAVIEQPPYFRAPPHPLSPAAPREQEPYVGEPGVRGPHDTEVIDAHTYTCGMLMQASLDERNLVEDRAQMYTAGWLLRQGEKRAAYPLLAEVKDPELRRMMIAATSTLVDDHHTMSRGIRRASMDSDLGQQWLSGAYIRAAETEGYTDVVAFAQAVAGTFDALKTNDRQKIEGLLIAGLGVDDVQVCDLLVSYLDFMQQQNTARTNTTRSRLAVSNVKGMLAQYWISPDDMSQTIRICNTMSSEEDARSLVTHIFEPLLAGYGQIPTDKIIEIWSNIDDLKVLSQVTTETNWMIRKIDIFKLKRIVDELEQSGNYEQQRIARLRTAVRLRSAQRGGPIGGSSGI